METMSYKDFVWPRNPHTYQESYSREGVYEKNDYNEDVFQGMGFKKCKITGSGVFMGERAYDDFRRLIELFNETSAGNLEHPIWGIRYCYFTGLELTQEPADNCISYRFEFSLAMTNGILPR